MHKKSIFVYLEEYTNQNNSLIIDFDQSFDFGAILPIIGFPDLDFYESPSMIEVLNYNPNAFERTRVTEGTTYELNLNAVAEIVERGQLNAISDSLVIGFEFDMTDISNDLFGDTKSKVQNTIDKLIDNSGQVYGEIMHLPDKLPELGKENTIVVRKVGQANWNELIVDGKTTLYYDFGAPARASRSVVNELISSRLSTLEEDNPNLIISHWDIDHYHCLLGLDDSSIIKFSSILAREDRPNQTTRRIQGRIKKLMNEKYFPIPAVPKPKKIRRSVVPLELIYELSDNQIKVFNGEYHRDRNKSGIVVLIQSERASAILGADHHYNQLNTYVIPELNEGVDHYLIVPHHGGNAGRFIYELSWKHKPKEAVISVGQNNYNHPLESIKQKLRDLRFKVLQTNIVGKDITFNI